MLGKLFAVPAKTNPAHGAPDDVLAELLATPLGARSPVGTELAALEHDRITHLQARADARRGVKGARLAGDTRSARAFEETAEAEDAALADLEARLATLERAHAAFVD